MKTAVREFSPFVASWLVMLFGLSILSPAVVYRREFRLPRMDEIFPLMLLGFMGASVLINVQFSGIIRAGAANAGWITAALPPISILLCMIFLRERPSRFEAFGVAISIVGVLLVVRLGGVWSGALHPSDAGETLIAISVVDLAAFRILYRNLAGDRPETLSAFWMSVFAATIQTAIVLSRHTGELAGLLHVSMTGWCSVVFLGAARFGLVPLMWTDGASALPALRMNTFALAAPILGMALAYHIIGERFTIFAYLGGAVALAGIWMAGDRYV
jgi:drug/metabolite transporter (DMT)-like permease